jgi:hypothetical protein
VYSLSHLRLARVLVLQNKPDPARDEYHAFFAAWKSADADLPLPVQSHAPLQRAKSGGISHGRVHRMNRQFRMAFLDVGQSNAVPEPATAGFFALGLAALGLLGRRTLKRR